MKHKNKKTQITAIKVGLTGGIGCGKSAATQLFREKGIPIIDADRIAKAIVQPDQAVLADIVQQFGKNILHANGHLDRSALRKLIFDNDAKRKQLEAILHPRIKHIIQKKMADYAYDYPYIIVDVPLLVEKNYQQLFDYIIVVDCLPEQQLSRVTARDNATPQQVQAILASQASREYRSRFADEILDNSGSLDKLRKQVTRCHDKLCLLNNE